MELFKELFNYIISEDCFNILIINKVFNEYCIKEIISKLLSVGILAGSVLFKLPQVRKRKKSGKGEGVGKEEGGRERERREILMKIS